MGRRRNRSGGAAAVAAALTVTLAVGIAAPSSATGYSPTGTPPAAAPAVDPTLPPDIAAFLDAKQRLPAARRAAADARQAVAAAQTAADTAAAQAQTAAQAADTATGTARTAAHAAAVADTTAARARDDVATVARALYMSGGTATPLDPFLANPDSPESLTRAMDTQAYLQAASHHEIADADTAQAAADTAHTAAAAAADTAAAATDALTVARAAATDARNRLAEAQARYTAAAADLDRLAAVTFTPADGQYTTPKNCGNDLALTLARAGFEGENLREAWAIAMRESGGDGTIGPGHPAFNGADYGLFQLNKPTWGTQPWWDDAAVRDGGYNARIAHMLSRGGTTWYAWGLDGSGRPAPGAYLNVGWTAERILSHIVEPYLRWYAAYPCA